LRGSRKESLRGSADLQTASSGKPQSKVDGKPRSKLDELKEAIRRNNIDRIIFLAPKLEGESVAEAVHLLEAYYRKEMRAAEEITKIVNEAQIRLNLQKIPSDGNYAYALQ